MSKEELIALAERRLDAAVREGNWSMSEKLALTCRILFDGGHDSGLAGQITSRAEAGTHSHACAVYLRTVNARSPAGTSILSKLVDPLDTTVARLLGQEVRQHDVVVMRHDQQTVLVDPDTGFSRRILSPILPGRGLDFVMAQMPAKSDTGPVVAHTLPVEEYMYVLSGSLSVTIGDTRTVLNASDSLYYRADAPHRFENPGRASAGI
jgi:mannose-6-phosphate isomerase-like protein (cupin superfamily)